MDMYHIIWPKGAAKCREERGSHSCQSFFVNGGYCFKSHTFVFADSFGVKGRAAHVMTAAVVTGDRMALLCHSGCKLLYDHFHTALTGRDTFLASCCQVRYKNFGVIF